MMGRLFPALLVILLLAGLGAWYFFPSTESPAKDISVNKTEPPVLTRLKKTEVAPAVPKSVCVVADHDTALEGVVVNPHLRPLPGAMVILCPWDGQTAQLESAFASAFPQGRRSRSGRPDLFNALGRAVKEILSSPCRVTTQADGAFTFKGLSPGLWRAMALSPNRQPVMSGTLMVLQKETCRTELMLPAALQISGRVSFPDGRGVDGAFVRAQWAFNENMDRFREQPHLSVDVMLKQALGALPTDGQTDEDGLFAFPAMTPGTYRIFAVKEGFAPAQPRIVTLSETSAEGAASKNVALTIQQGLAFAGSVQDMSGFPIAGAEVVLVHEEDQGDFSGSLRNLMEPHDFSNRFGTESDIHGGFTIPDLREGAYTLVVKREAFQPGIFRGIRVSPGLNNPTVFRLKRGLSLYGQVLDEKNKPLAGVVHLWTHSNPAQPIWPHFESAPDERGRFHFTSLSPGQYRLQVISDHHVEHTQSIEVGGNEPVMVKLVRGATLQGTVLNNGKPVSNARIQATLPRDDSASWMNRSRQRPISTRTDIQGRFLLKNLPQGPLEVEADAQGFIEKRVSISMSPGGAQTCTLALVQAGLITGTVATAEGKPIPGAKITLFRQPVDSEERPPDAPRRSFRRRSGRRPVGLGVFSDKQGQWALPVSKKIDQACVEASHPDFLSMESERFQVQDPAAAGPALTLVMSAGHALTGTVQTPDGAPLSRVRVQVRLTRNRGEGGGPPGSADRPPFPSWGFRSGTLKEDMTDETGRWRVSGLQTGAYVVSIRQPPYAPYFENVALDSSEPTRLSVTLQPAAAIRGVITDRDGPVISAWVSIWGNGIVQNTFCDQAGAFVLEGLIPDKRYQLIVHAEGYLACKEEVLAPADNLACRLVMPAALSGYVISGNPALPVQPFRVTLEPESPTEHRVPGPEIFRTEDGSFLMLDIPPGLYTIRIETKTLPPATFNNVLLWEADFREDVDIFLEEGPVLTGSVRLPDGAPAAGASVSARLEGQEASEAGAKKDDSPKSPPPFPGRRRWGPRDREREQETFLAAGKGKASGSGAFVLKGLLPGVWQVMADHPDWGPSAAVTVTVTPEGISPKAIQLDLTAPEK